MKRKTKIKTKINAPLQTGATTYKPKPVDLARPLIEHLLELRRRLGWVAFSVLVFSGVGYGIQQTLIGLLLKPAHEQRFIYTTPGGGINFLLQVCLYFGILMSLPIMLYHTLKYFEPLIHLPGKRFMLRCGLLSFMLAAAGVIFGYSLGLPAALHFLTNQFTNTQVQALLNIGDYLSFTTIYLLCSALLFQIPLVMLFINRIRPLRPGSMLRAERYVIVAAFIIAAIVTPTPDIFNQALIAGPMIIVYQLGIALVLTSNALARHKFGRTGRHVTNVQSEPVRHGLAHVANSTSTALLPLPEVPERTSLPYINALIRPQRVSRLQLQPEPAKRSPVTVLNARPSY